MRIPHRPRLAVPATDVRTWDGASFPAVEAQRGDSGFASRRRLMLPPGMTTDPHRVSLAQKPRQDDQPRPTRRVDRGPVVREMAR